MKSSRLSVIVIIAGIILVGNFVLAPVVANAQSAKEWVDKGETSLKKRESLRRQ